PVQFGSRGPPGDTPLAHLGNALFSLPLLCNRPACQDRPPCQPLRNPMLGREPHSRFCLFLSYLPFSTKLMDHGSNGKDKSETEGMRQLPGLALCRIYPLQGLVWIAEIPKVHGRIELAHQTRVCSIDKGQGTVLLGVVESNTLFTVLKGCGKLSTLE